MFVVSAQFGIFKIIPNTWIMMELSRIKGLTKERIRVVSIGWIIIIGWRRFGRIRRVWMRRHGEKLSQSVWLACLFVYTHGMSRPKNSAFAVFCPSCPRLRLLCDTQVSFCLSEAMMIARGLSWPKCGEVVAPASGAFAHAAICAWLFCICALLQHLLSSVLLELALESTMKQWRLQLRRMAWLSMSFESPASRACPWTGSVSQE